MGLGVVVSTEVGYGYVKWYRYENQKWVEVPTSWGDLDFSRDFLDLGTEVKRLPSFIPTPFGLRRDLQPQEYHLNSSGRSGDLTRPLFLDWK